MGQEPTDAPTPPGQEPAAPGQEPAPKDTPTPGSEPKTFDEPYVKQLRAEAADWRTKHQALEQKVRAFEDKDKTETERLAEQAKREAESRTAAEQERDQLRGRLDRFEIATKVGLDPFWADRLQGSTREELETDAARIKEREGTSRPAGDWDGGPRGGTPPALPDDADPLQRLTHAYGERK